MNVLITGANGFLGRNLLSIVREQNAIPDENIILLTSTPINNYKCVIHGNYSYCKEEYEKIGVMFIDAVIHIGAAKPQSGKEIEDLERYYQNVKNTYHLISTLPNIPSKFIYISTVSVYGESFNERISESTVPSPISLYGMSKLFCEKMLESWAIDNKVILQILRVGQLFGRGEAHAGLIPTIIRCVNDGTNPIIYTMGEELRSYLHVNDCANAIISALRYNRQLPIINVVSRNEHTVLEIVNLIIRISGKSLEPIVTGVEKNATSYIFDASKMLQYLGMEKVNLAEGILDEMKHFNDLCT